MAVITSGNLKNREITSMKKTTVMTTNRQPTDNAHCQTDNGASAFCCHFDTPNCDNNLPRSHLMKKFILLGLAVAACATTASASGL